MEKMGGAVLLPCVVGTLYCSVLRARGIPAPLLLPCAVRAYSVAPAVMCCRSLSFLPCAAMRCRWLPCAVVYCRSLSLAAIQCRALSVRAICCRFLSFNVVRCRTLPLCANDCHPLSFFTVLSCNYYCCCYCFGLLPLLLLQLLCAASSRLCGLAGCTWSAVHGSFALAPCPHSQQVTALSLTCFALRW
jgi:hypothetical protein